MTIPSFSAVERNEAPKDSQSEIMNLREWLKKISSYDNLYVKHSGIETLNLPLSFDIETTSWHDVKDNRRATMYAFVIGVYGEVFAGRTWDDFLAMISEIISAFSLGNFRKAVIYVHNLSYEFQWICQKFEWESVFAIEERRVIRAETKSGIVFKDSYALSGYSLAKVGEHLRRYPIQKMVGDLDYCLMRNSKTPLSLKEWRYIYHDGLVVMDYIMEEIEENHNDITKIPLTKTGKVRRYMRNQCLYERQSGKHDYKSHKYGDYRRIMKRETLTDEEYRLARLAFQGGFTHCNAIHMGDVCEDVQSMDFTSSYPSVMIDEKFPCSKGKKAVLKSEEDFDRLDNAGYLMIFGVRLYDLCSLEEGDHPISKSDDHSGTECREDNGRVVDSPMVSLACTNIDFRVYRKFYKWSRAEFGLCYVYQKDYLPQDFVKGIVQLYKDKTKLKGVKGMENEYQVAKENLNSCYGMCVTDISRKKYIFEKGTGWSSEDKDISRDIERYNDSKTRFNSYLWGIFVTAYARRNLFYAIYALKDDYIYSDTDSVKFRNYEKHKDFFDSYNDLVKEKLRKACDRQGIPIEDVSPKTIEGKVKTIGLWDDDGHYRRFKTLGSKRYMIEKDNGDIMITIAGVNKKCGVDYLRYRYKTNDRIFKAFSDRLTFPPEYYDHGVRKEGSGKKTLTYIDEPTSGVMTDYLGNTAAWSETSSVCMESAAYDLGIASQYLTYVLGIKEIEVL